MKMRVLNNIERRREPRPPPQNMASPASPPARPSKTALASSSPALRAEMSRERQRRERERTEWGRRTERDLEYERSSRGAGRPERMVHKVAPDAVHNRIG